VCDNQSSVLLTPLNSLSVRSWEGVKDLYLHVHSTFVASNPICCASFMPMASCLLSTTGLFCEPSVVLAVICMKCSPAHASSCLGLHSVACTCLTPQQLQKGVLQCAKVVKLPLGLDVQRTMIKSGGLWFSVHCCCYADDCQCAARFLTCFSSCTSLQTAIGNMSSAVLSSWSAKQNKYQQTTALVMQQDFKPCRANHRSQNIFYQCSPESCHLSKMCTFLDSANTSLYYPRELRVFLGI
jgi:hypothetical protein